jgi:hypothetical protein
VSLVGQALASPRRSADFGVDEWHGTNAFIGEGDQIFRTYFTDGRGDEALGTTWSYLDMTPLGRQEEWEDSPEGYPQTRCTGGGTTTTRTETPRDRAPRGVPLEELLPSAVGAGAGLLVVRVWLMLRLRRDERRGPRVDQSANDWRHDDR